VPLFAHGDIAAALLQKMGIDEAWILHGRPPPFSLGTRRAAAEAACYIVPMPSGYVPIFIFLVVAIAFPIVLIVLMKLIRPSAPSVTKLEAYECGIKAASDSRGRYTVRFYIIAILFVIFDVETIFLFPWAVRYRALGWFGVAEVAVFLAILVVGYIWAYKKGALEWV
jgi:NADH-quinone oxidoreductase subunit A